MCRMILALGNFNPLHLIDSMFFIAQDQNTIHEFNQREGWGSWQHSDGWGLAYLKDGKWEIKKSIKPVYQDDQIDQFRSIQTNFALLHARKANVGETALKNTHPFQKDDFIFCHNGHNRDQFKIHPNFQPQGDTDSERIFYDILHQFPTKEIPQAIRNTFHRYPYYKGAVIVLANPKKTFIATRANVFPKYYRLYLAKAKDYLILSSEIPRNLAELDWQPLENTTLEIDNQTLEIINHKPPQII